MDDVARRAGVSGATVSHVLNETRRVSDSTRKKVEAAIRETGYRHNTLARALAAGRTHTIGMCVPILTNPYIANLVNAMETAASEAGYTLMIGDSRDDAEIEVRTVNTFLERRVDGIIVAPGVDSQRLTMPLLEASGIPLVLIDRHVREVDADQVFAEGIDSTKRLTSHMLEHGHREIAVLAGTPGIRSTDERLEGFRAAFAARGLEVDPELVVVGNSNAESSERALLELLGRRRPEAVVALNNAMTIGAMRAFRGLGLRVPQDIALASFDDFEWADLFEPRITALAQDVAGMGRQALELLVARIADPERPTRLVSLAPALHVRDSCGVDRHSAADSIGSDA
ncbi:LacI family transcriptional regulator [Herbiconiux sp. CPCC 203407]|uniref:LacI family transcriptional regulator n=1 Tax=Herbiconiux oxytropis TaxID=2970915 RepID=A0AA41XG38_9MICO|nr:LacI family DNA-binding transcriptional regulator [Herbiconiux oxytropis]MCS5720623.1 LacI family transcriptional regulator [Herbiconiux oxytropis]MCS5725050.1 LacI family transcriptional regulator [Herbiconiux oxytropis]